MREELFGSRFSLHALLSLLPDEWCIADLGCGTGSVAEAIAPHVRNVTCVDASTAMLEIAAQRLQRFDNVDLRHGKLESLPIDDGQMDAATLILVLHHLEHPGAAVLEAARCLREGGQIVIVDMLPHDRVEYQQEMGHAWLGFSEETLNEFMKQAGFGAARFSALPPAPDAKGPNLFVLSATKRST